MGGNDSVGGAFGGGERAFDVAGRDRCRLGGGPVESAVTGRLLVERVGVGRRPGVRGGAWRGRVVVGAPVLDDDLGRSGRSRSEELDELADDLLVGRRGNTRCKRSESEQRRRDAAGSAHVVHFAERTEVADRSSRQPVTTPERLGIHGHRLGDVAHPHRSGGRECDERLREGGPEGDLVDRERRRQRQDYVASGVRSTGVADAHVAVVVVADLVHRRAQHHGVTEAVGETLGERGGTVAEAAGGDVDRVAGDPLSAGGDVVHRVAREVLAVGGDVHVVDQRCHSPLTGPEPCGAQVEPTGRADVGEETPADAVSALEHHAGHAGVDQSSRHDEPGDSGAHDDDVDVARRGRFETAVVVTRHVESPARSSGGSGRAGSRSGP